MTANNSNVNVAGSNKSVSAPEAVVTRKKLDLKETTFLVFRSYKDPNFVPDPFNPFQREASIVRLPVLSFTGEQLIALFPCSTPQVLNSKPGHQWDMFKFHGSENVEAHDFARRHGFLDLRPSKFRFGDQEVESGADPMLTEGIKIGTFHPDLNPGGLKFMKVFVKQPLPGEI